MIRFLIAAAAILAVTAAEAQESRTTRILEKPIYGATVTMEHGVRVYRPIPPDGQVIINPGGRTPVIINSGVAVSGVPVVAPR